uniref:Uncharacterized protein n=1 Tax=Lactuca sativa TaxID=4236 RepID=A0A9R1X2L2_LACSA|nr:hypothetical protein LSAT_V11C700372700 [Lactuca sativa]
MNKVLLKYILFVLTGPSQLVFENAPRRKRSILDQFVISPIERLNKQLLDFAHEQPDVYLNKPTDRDVLIDRADVATSTPLGTALGALLLVPPHELIKQPNSTTETIIASNLKEKRW